MRTKRTASNIVRSAACVALCYVIAAHAFVAGYGLAFAMASAGDTLAGAVICHGNASDEPRSPSEDNPPHVNCALCAIAASASGLPSNPSWTLVAPPVLSCQLQLSQGHRIVVRTIRRAGLARAPPHLV
ncbi:MAG: DUF2946 family protein [Xanthobacteraceae bacterium]